jgi:hypothetical protein
MSRTAKEVGLLICTRTTNLHDGTSMLLKYRLRNSYINLVAGLIAYCRQPKKPSLRLDSHPMLVVA